MVDIAYGSEQGAKKTYFLQHNIHYRYCTDLSIFANLCRVTVAFEQGQEDMSGLSKKEKDGLVSCVMFCTSITYQPLT